MVRITGITADYTRLRGSCRTRTVGTEAPMFGWQAVSDVQNDVQSAYRVTVAAKDALLWDTGRVADSRQSVRYGGAALPDGTALQVTVRIWDGQGRESEPYAETFYMAGIREPAAWIAAPDAVKRRPVRFGRSFTLDAVPENAYAYFCGLGYHVLYLNGERVGTAKLDPAHSDYSKTCYYTLEAELQRFLRKGENRIELLVGDGWRNFDSPFLLMHLGGRPPAFSGLLQASAVLRMQYADGAVSDVQTDGSWEWSYGPVTEASIYDGETYDARENGTPWRPVSSVPAPGGVMRPMLLPPIEEQECYSPVDVFCLHEDAYIVDFGQNMAGVARLRLPKTLQAGQTVAMAYAEELDETGDLYMEPLRGARCTDFYIAAGDTRDLAQWQPEFTYHGFRYLRVTGYGRPLTREDVTAVSLYTDVRGNGRFTCGAPLLNRIHTNAVMTEKSNIHSVMTDCPQRNERLGWMNDATVRFEETPYNFEIGRLFPKVVQDILDTQGADGSITCTAPFVVGQRPADPVCSAFLVAGMQALLHTGNVSLIAHAYDGFRRWEDCLLAHSDGYLVTYSYYGDWAGPAYACVDEENAKSAVTPGELVSTGFSYLNCKMLAEFAACLGLTGDRARYIEIAAKIRDAFLGKWLDRRTGRVATGSQACQSFALWLGILPTPCRAPAAALLHEDLEARHYRITTGNLCTRYLLDALTENGYVDDAYRILMQDTYPSLGFMIQHEATTVWERFELKKNPSMNSHNHPMYGSVDHWFYAHLCGLRPLQAGWTLAEIRPHYPEGLLSASASVETPFGTLSVRWTRRYGGTQLSAVVPFGMRARITHGDRTEEVGAGSYFFAD